MSWTASSGMNFLHYLSIMINKILLFIRIVWGSRILVIERQYYPKKKRDGLTLWGTETNKAEQVNMLEMMAKSIELEMTPKERADLRNLQLNRNTCQSPQASTIQSAASTRRQ